MLRTEAARYARWSASVALLLAGATLFVYLQRGWVRHQERKKAPPPAPVEVSRQLNGITFKKEEQNRTIFTVTASKSIEFKGKEDNLLQDVIITIFGKGGDRHDVMQTKSCQYGRANGGIVCSGDVQITLMSARDAQRTAGDPAAAKSVTTQVETHGVVFDRASGLAQTDQRVDFVFPSGHGEAQGLEYRSEKGSLVLRQNVHLTLTPSGAKVGAKPGGNRAAAGKPAQEIQVRGTRLEFGRDTRLMRLFGPAEAEMSTQELTAAELTLSLDKQFHAEKLIASSGNGARPVLTNEDPNNQVRLDADSVIAYFSPEGGVMKLEARGGVHGTRNSPVEQEEASADLGTADLWPGTGTQVKQLNLTGNVVLKTRAAKSGDSRSLQTSALRMQFAGGQPGATNSPVSAETLAPGTMEWTDNLQPSGTPAHTKLQGDKLEMQFAPQRKFAAVGKTSVSAQPKQLTATGNVQTERLVAGKPTQTATARNGAVELQPAGGWSQMDLQGDVKLKQGDHFGEAEHAVFLRASQVAALTGNAVARDATTETHATKISFSQASGDIHAEGGVRSTDLSARSSAVQLAPAPANITSDALQANSKTGRALYTGHARMWQGDSVLEADSIELLREVRVLNALGNVRAVFPQTPARPTAGAAQLASARIPERALAPVSTSQATLRKPELWHVSAGKLTYHDLDERAHLEKNVVAQSPEQIMRCPALDLYFTRTSQPGRSPGSATQPAGTGTALAGAQQISRAVGSGGVTVEEDSRKATAEHGEYLAATGKFVMTGGNPTIYDGSEGTTTGRQLTFFLADDTIIVDSEKGSRTLTKHRVEK